MGFFITKERATIATGDDPGLLALATSEDGGLKVTPTAAYFDGPLVVQTSFGAMVIAAILGGAAFIIPAAFGGVNDGGPLSQFMAMRGPGKAVIQGVLGFAILSLPPLAIAHRVCRGLNASSYRAYALAGLVGPIVFAFLLATGVGAFALIYAILFAAPSLVAMLSYRRLAGLEPAPLPDDIEVQDSRTLIAADHPRRHMARVINMRD